MYSICYWARGQPRAHGDAGRGLARRGIFALVDDATGYRADQIKEDVLRVIAEYMSPRLVTLTKRFLPDFFEEVYRLHGWEYKRGNTHHPQYTGEFHHQVHLRALARRGA